jgi:transposase-like protein
MAKWQRYSLDFKRRAVAQMARCDSIVALARELKLHPSLLYIWKHQLDGTPGRGRNDLSQHRARSVEKLLREENRLLKEALGQRVLEVDFFADALRSLKEQRHTSAASAGRPSTAPSKGGVKKRRKAD